MPTTLHECVQFPTRAKRHVTDVAITHRYTSRCGRYLVDHVHWVLKGYPDFWASWYVGESILRTGKRKWVRLGPHRKKRTAMAACLRHAKRQAAIASN